MLSTKLNNRKAEQGFTLVELAVVMIIIGLLIGGILKGQELIANAQITATISQVKGIDSAIATFRDKYAALPGDMASPSTRLPNCTAAPCNDAGDANGRIDTPALGGTPTNTTEGAIAFVHMAASDLISGIVTNNNTAAFGVMMPEAKIGGGYWLGFTSDGTAAGSVTGLRSGHYLVFNGSTAAVDGATSGAVTPTQAAQIDRKLDDGVPNAGSVQSTGTGCITTNTYTESDQTALCSMYMRVQG